MTKQQLFDETILPQIRSAQVAQILQPVQVGKTPLENELMFFIKPELLAVTEDALILNSLDLVQEKLQAFDVQVDGTVIIPGAALEQFEIMNRHYGFINQLSRAASDIVDADQRQQIYQALSLNNGQETRILGGHQFLETFGADLDTLSKVWFAQEARKLRSGFYFIKDTFQGEPIVLVNGFHPSQLAHFTREDHRILLLLLHTDTDWFNLKFDLVGDTFPERAKPTSIRGMLYAHLEKYGQAQVGINTNGVHLSAGPFEAAFEVVNFFGSLLHLDPAETPPLAIRKAMEAGISQEDALGLLKNPALKDSDLFSETENINTDEAVRLVIDQLIG